MASKRILLICRKAPYGNALARAAADMALAAGAFDQELAIAFIGDGVWQTIDQQDSTDIQQKNHQKLLSAFELYGISESYVEAEALTERQIEPSRLSLAAKPVNQQQLSELFEQADMLLTV
ncbi:sulfurtransferase complex subunit TusC [Oceanicoccus sagamiensis]|uniref:Sulfurtransferase TusC n=1 Tax=Oceanicoccus sagamiensis TaxID=716816 RepID=A0A1X9NI62_9GAMM|nr:sulfurtransferase complex subunit TusC [Oceanicoccus sagamiensis]ARN75525.1 sulfurtransferase TusC [Oceanicoccus sagamiensis]